MASPEMRPSVSEIEVGQKADTPTLILQSVLGNTTVLKELITDGPGKTSILEKAKQQINSLDPQEKVLFLEKTFAILSDPNPEYQNKRDAALDILRVMDLTNVNPENLKKAYVKAVSALRENLSQDSDPYGEIHMVLEAGKTIAPFIEKRKHVTQAWNPVARAFRGSDRQKILDDVKEIRQLIPKTFSEFDAKVLMLVEEGLRSQEIAALLSVPTEDIQRSKYRLKNKGIRFKSFNRTKR